MTGETDGKGSVKPWVLGTLLFSLLIMTLMSWPLPRYMGEGIPSSAGNIEQPPARYSIQGDHLQLLYHFDLMHDMITGRIPWFYDPYEFNTGSDEDRYRPHAYFLPMSGVYAFFARFLGRPAAWNLVLWLSVWLSALFTWGWLRRFTSDKLAISLGVLIALLLPFRWASLFGGSPAGMALLWVPLIAWGIDVAVRSPAWSTGAWIGSALLMCFWSDLQVFYFAMLSIPVFFAISLFAAAMEKSVAWRKWYRVMPLGLVFAVIMAAYHLWKKHSLNESMMGSGRTWHEVALFSPSKIGWIQHSRGIDDTVFIGTAILGAVILGTVLMLVRAIKQRKSVVGHCVLYLGVAGLAIVTLCLAMGVNGPFHALLLRIARGHIPYYDMIRQPSKIYALMPLWLGWLAAVGWSAYLKPASRCTVRRVLMLLFACWMLIQISSSVSATVSLFEEKQDAYAAVAKDAGSETAHAVVIPLWPGDSADTSLAIDYARQYDIRLVNGYSPVVSSAYFTNVFRRLQSINEGWLEDDQITFLTDRGIDYILLHENQFPEKVSPFPVALTRDRLLAHPRLEFLKQDGPVWAFKILPEKSNTDRATRKNVIRFPTRHWNFGRKGEKGKRVSDTTAHRGQYLMMEAGDEGITAGPWRVAPGDDLNWLVRVRGYGRLRLSVKLDDEWLESKEFQATDNAEWSWHSVPLPELPHFGQVRVLIESVEGRIDADTGLLIQGDWKPGLANGENRSIPAADFFHAGYSDQHDQSVVFRPAYDQDRGVFYGPKLPLKPGQYTSTWEMTVDAPAGTEAGRLVLTDYVANEKQTVPVIAGKPVLLEWDQKTSGLVKWIYEYNRAAKVTIFRVNLSVRKE